MNWPSGIVGAILTLLVVVVGIILFVWLVKVVLIPLVNDSETALALIGMVV